MRIAVLLLVSLGLGGCGLVLDLSPDDDADGGAAGIDAAVADASAADGAVGDAGGLRTDAARPDGGPGDDAGLCSYSPCDLVAPQCGCPSGEACYFSGGPGCSPAGSGPEDALCEVNQECRAGLGCVSGSGESTGLCRRYCRAEDDCGGPSRCLQLGPIGTGNAGYCETACDPVMRSGCPPGLQCVIAVVPQLPDGMDVEVSGCVEVGSIPAGSPCNSLGGGCVPGASCDGSGTCRNVCYAGDSSVCSRGSCATLMISRGGTRLGICAGT